MSNTRRYAALAVGASLLLAAGCGSSDEEGEPLPRDTVAAIAERLDEVQRRFDVGTNDDNRGACEDIENDSYKAIDSQVEGLPEDVDADVRNALEDSLARLQELTREGCSAVEEERPEPETTPEETVPERTVPEETVPERTETEQTVPEQTKPKKQDENGSGNGGGETTPPADTVAPPGNSGGQIAPDADDG